MSEFAITLATPKYSVGNGYSGTIYLRIKKHYAHHRSAGNTSKRTACAKTHHRPSQTARDQSKPHEQHQLGFPRHSVTAVRIAIGNQPRLLDRVDTGHQATSAVASRGVGGGEGTHTSIPRTLQISGIQSGNVIWMSPSFATLLYTAASMKNQNPKENYRHLRQCERLPGGKAELTRAPDM